jgi:hypothetical protein
MHRAPPQILAQSSQPPTIDISPVQFHSQDEGCRKIHQTASRNIVILHRKISELVSFTGRAPTMISSKVGMSKRKYIRQISIVYPVYTALQDLPTPNLTIIVVTLESWNK